MNDTVPSRRVLLVSAALIALVAVALVLSLPARSVQAQSPTPSDDDVNRVAHKLYCPVCENTPLDVCPTEACRQWRDLIRQQLSEGWSESRIQQYFVDQYGARVLAEPPPTGLNWLIYVLPPIIILAGVILLVRSMRSWTSASSAQKPGAGPKAAPASRPDPKSEEYAARLEDELKKRS